MWTNWVFIFLNFLCRAVPCWPSLFLSGHTVCWVLWFICLICCRHCWIWLCCWRGTLSLSWFRWIIMLYIAFFITMPKYNTLEAVILDIDLSTNLVIKWLRWWWWSFFGIWWRWSIWGLPSMGRWSIVEVVGFVDICISCWKEGRALLSTGTASEILLSLLIYNHGVDLSQI